MLNKNNQNQKIVAKKMEAKKHFRCKLPTNLHETSHLLHKKKAAIMIHTKIRTLRKPSFAKIRIISVIQGSGKSEIRPWLKQPTANIQAIPLQLNGP